MTGNYNLIVALLIAILSLSCRDDESLVESADPADEEVVDTASYPDWTDATHSKSADLNYDIVFNQNEVLRFDIEISNENWANMQADLSTVLGSTASGGGGGGGGRPEVAVSTAIVDSDPMWVPCSLKFNDIEWYQVGVRYKGNSSLTSAYQSGNGKLSLKLDFDEFEDDYEGIKNQRFYGFKQLNLNNNFDDASLMREKVGADLFRQFGLASAQTAFCVVYVDYGSGPQYFGVYTLVEEVDDTVIDTQFSSGDGNLYKPDGDAASFANGTYDIDEMELKTNEEIADYTDIQALYDVINSSDRTSNTEEWKSSLESVMNVDGFMKWLAANTVIQNWDTYGRMTHNFYLYNNPDDSLLTWIPWDNNEAFQEGKSGGALSLSMNEIGTNWPLINYLIAVDEYELIYEAYLQQFINDVFIPSELSAAYSTYYTLLKDHAYAEETGYTFLRSGAEFDSAVETLKSHAQQRNDAVNSYLQ